jgi:hypothetical protein
LPDHAHIGISGKNGNVVRSAGCELDAKLGKTGNTSLLLTVFKLRVLDVLCGSHFPTLQI